MHKFATNRRTKSTSFYFIETDTNSPVAFYARFQIQTLVIHNLAFGETTTCSLVGGYQCSKREDEDSVFITNVGSCKLHGSINKKSRKYFNTSPTVSLHLSHQNTCEAYEDDRLGTLIQKSAY